MKFLKITFGLFVGIMMTSCESMVPEIIKDLGFYEPSLESELKNAKTLPEEVFILFKAHQISERDFRQDIDTFEYLNDNYTKDKKAVYYYSGSKAPTITIKDADPQTFQLLGHAFTRDKNHIYLHGEKFMPEVVDPESFKPLGQNYAKDKKNVYIVFRGIFADADAQTFELINPYAQYGRDKNHVFHLHRKVEGADPKSFVVLARSWGRDKNNLYRRNNISTDNEVPARDILRFKTNNERLTRKILEIDREADQKEKLHRISQRVKPSENKLMVLYHNIYVYKDLLFHVPDHPMRVEEVTNLSQKYGFKTDSFQRLSSQYARVGSQIINTTSIQYKAPVVSTSAESFEILGRDFTKDANGVYIWDKRIKNADPSTVTLLPGAGWYKTLWRDKDRIYLKDQAIVGADPETFEIIKSKVYPAAVGKEYSLAKDKNHIYFRTNRVPDADIETFEVIDESSYFRDQNNVYYQNQKLEEADPQSFVVFESSGWAKDAQSVFYKGKKNPKLDASSFEMISAEGFFRDKNFVYRGKEEIKGADPETFEIFSKSDFSRDKNYVYEKTRIREGEDPATFGIERGLVLHGQSTNTAAELEKNLMEADRKNIPFLDSVASGKKSKIQKDLKNGSDINYRTTADWYFVNRKRKFAAKDWNGNHSPLGINPLNFIKIITGTTEKDREKYRNKDKVFLAKESFPLLLSVKLGDREIVQFLLQQGAKIDMRDKNGETALFEAVRQNDLEMAEILIEAGSDINAKGRYEYMSKCLLEIAEKEKLIEMKKLLIGAGASLECEKK